MATRESTAFVTAREGSSRGRLPRVIHLFPRDLVRGAQVYARALCDAMQAQGEDHRAMTVFVSSPGALRAELSLGVRPGAWKVGGVSVRAVRRLRRALLTGEVDIVVAHGGEALKYAALGRPAGVHLVYYKLGISRIRLGGRLRLRLWRALAARTDAVAAVSEETAAEARELFGVARERVFVIPNGRDPAHLRPGRARPPRERPKLVSVGYLVPDKRPELFCSVVSTVRERGVPIEALLVGDGPLFVSLGPLAEAAGVTMLGRRDDVPAILADSDVLVFTGSGELEGMPGVLIEAGLCGLPAVTTAVPGARTVVEDHSTGFVVAVDDREALIDRVLRLASDPFLRSRMGSAARARCLERFTIEASVLRWQGVLDSVR